MVYIFLFIFFVHIVPVELSLGIGLSSSYTVPTERKQIYLRRLPIFRSYGTKVALELFCIFYFLRAKLDSAVVANL